MISSFFKKTKPINYLMVALLVILAALFGFLGEYTDVYAAQWLSYSVNLVLALFTVFVAGVIVFQNKLTGVNTYAIFIFAVLLLIFPSVLFNTKVMVANLLILLSLRRLFGLHTRRIAKAKIFDSFLMLGLACFLNQWCVVFFLIGLLCILFYDYRDFRNWLTVLVSLGVLFVGYVIYMFYIEKSCVTFPFTYNLELTQNLESYQHISFLLPLSVLFVVGLWAVVVYLVSFQSKSVHLQKPYWILLIMLVLATFMELLASFDKGAGMVYLFFPISIFITSLLERLNSKYIKETVIWLLLLLPIVRLML